MGLWAFTEVFIRVPIKDERFGQSGVPSSRPQSLRLGALMCGESQDRKSASISGGRGKDKTTMR